MPDPHGRVSDSCPACVPPPTDSDIGVDGAKAFAEALKVNGTLTELNVYFMLPLPIRKE